MHLSELCSNRYNIKFIKRLAQYEVEFIIIGGAAIYYHGGREPEDVNDIDIYVKPDLDNINKLTEVFQFFNLKLVTDPKRLLNPYARLAINTNTVNIDIITPRDFEPFEELEARACEFDSMHPYILILGKEDCLTHKQITVNNVKERLAVHQKDLEFLHKAVIS